VDAVLAGAQTAPPEPVTPAAPDLVEAEASRAVFTPLDEPGLPEGIDAQNLDIVMDIPLEVSVELGRKRMSIRDILDLGSGSIVELDKIAGEPVDLLVNGRLVARGEVVVIEDNFGVRITEIVSGPSRGGAADRNAG
jgi:flagellar motor switch protein FliN/FliY